MKIEPFRDLKAVSDRELDWILAALRVYQTMLTMHSAVCQDVEDIATEHGPEPTVEELDALCERLNGGGKVIETKVPKLERVMVVGPHGAEEKDRTIEPKAGAVLVGGGGEPPKNRIHILNWRQHGDDETYCRIGVYGADDDGAVDTEIDVELGRTEEVLARDPESAEDWEHVVYVNDDILFADGDVLEHKGRRFRVRIEEVLDGQIDE